MSKHVDFDITPEEQAENEAFLRGREVAGERYIKRHSRQARWTHGITVSCCMWLMFSGAFVFVPPLAAMVGPDVVFAFRMSHRILGVVFGAHHQRHHGAGWCEAHYPQQHLPLDRRRQEVDDPVSAVSVHGQVDSHARPGRAEVWPACG